MVSLARPFGAGIAAADGITWRSALADFRADAARYVYYDDPAAKPTRLRLLRAFAANQGLQAAGLYRLARFLYGRGRRGIVATALARLGRLLYPALVRLNDVVNGIWISRDAEIGRGLYIAHPGCVVIGPAKIGANCNIGNSVTIGKNGRGEREGVPLVGDRVVISVGSRVLGRITIGDDVLIGPNSVVVRDVPARSVLLGVPARQIAQHGSFEYLSYPGMDADEPRARSLALMAA